LTPFFWTSLGLFLLEDEEPGLGLLDAPVEILEDPLHLSGISFSASKVFKFISNFLRLSPGLHLSSDLDSGASLIAFSIRCSEAGDVVGRLGNSATSSYNKSYNSGSTPIVSIN
jgi:hypothetical protein